MPPRNGALNDFIRLCRDINGTHMVGQVIAPAPRKGQGRAKSKNCFHYRRSGHFKRNCPAAKGAVNQSRKNQDVCPKCHKGVHWANDCHSKTDSQGNLIPMSENGRRSLPQAPKTQMYGVMSRPAVPIRYILQKKRLTVYDLV